MADINLGVGGANSAVAGGYDIENSLKLESDNSEYLKANNTFAYTTPTSRYTGTVSFWIKRTEIGNNVSGKTMYIFASSDSSRYTNLGFDEFDNLTMYSGDSSWNNVGPYTSNKFRDTAAWYHIVIRYDTTDSTASNRLRVYCNGTEVSWVVAPNITQNGVMTISGMNGPCWHSWGTIYSYYTPSNFFNGYLAEAHFVDGQSLAPTEFGEYDSASGIWKPKEYDGTYGNCGYYLDFEDSANLGNDESGNAFDFDENNITSADQATDTPTNNFCTMAGLWEYSVGNRVGVDGGTTTAATNSGYAWQGGKGTMGVTNGKWYFEFTIEGGATGFHTSFFVGWQTESTDASGSAHNTIGTIAYYGEGGGYIWVKDNTSGRTLSVTGSTTYGDIYGVALDLDSNPQTVIFYRNGSAITSNITLGSGLANETLFPFESTYYPQEISRWNFGGYTAMSIASGNTDENGYGNFEYAPPSGYYALCTKNLAEYG